VVVNNDTSQAFRIINNTTNTLFTDPGDGSLIPVAMAGGPFRGAVVFDSLTVRNAAFYDAGDNYVIAPAGAVVQESGGFIASFGIIRW